jgi:tRNA nucleotidyltransferase (CCA-adding enzyme)
MQIYLVGGAVRDRLLAAERGQPQPAGDRDWLVVGASPEEMVKAGYTPVGRDFPVFLHSKTHEEYALARTERKRAPGYHGFVFHAGREVTLEDDLVRRDLTINAMALDDHERLIDLHGGARDLRDRVLRHVSPAFAEDPVRILRLARFAARWPDFSVAPATLALCRAMVEAGEVDALVAERVWQEISRGLMEVRPSRLFELLRACGALARLLPEIDRLFGLPQMLDMAAQLQLPLAVRYACLGHEIGQGGTRQDPGPRQDDPGPHGAALLRSLAQRLRVPAALRDLAEMVAREHAEVDRAADLDAAEVLRLLQRCDAWRRPERFDELLQACECAARARAGQADAPYPPRQRLGQALTLTRAIDASAVVAQARAGGQSGPELSRALDQARIQALMAQGWPGVVTVERAPVTPQAPSAQPA